MGVCQRSRRKGPSGLYVGQQMKRQSQASNYERFVFFKKTYKASSSFAGTSWTGWHRTRQEGNALCAVCVTFQPRYKSRKVRDTCCLRDLQLNS